MHFRLQIKNKHLKVRRKQAAAYLLNAVHIEIWLLKLKFCYHTEGGGPLVGAGGGGGYVGSLITHCVVSVTILCIPFKYVMAFEPYR